MPPDRCIAGAEGQPWRQLGHSYVSTTTVYLQGIDVEEVIGTIHARPAPMIRVSAGFEL